MAAVQQTITVGSDSNVPAAKMQGFTDATMFNALSKARQLQNSKPGATATNRADAQAKITGGYVDVGDLVYIETRQANYRLKDAGSAGARPVDNGGSVLHVGSAGLYLETNFIYSPSPAQFGDEDDKTTTQAMQALWAWGSANLRGINLEEKEYVITAPIGKFTKALTVKGGGPTKSVIKLAATMTGWAVDFKETGFVVSDWTRDDDTITYNDEVSGVTFKDFSIVGDRSQGSAQGGVRFFDRNDNIHTSSFWVQHCSLGGFACGFLEDRTVGYIRESEFYDLQIRMCGDRTNPAMYIGSAGTGDATNQLDFYGLKVVWPFGTGLLMENLATNKDMRRVYFHGFMLHGQEDPVGTGKDLLAIVGNITNVRFNSFRTNAAESGGFGMAIRGDGSGNYPTGVKAQICTTNAHGGGIKIEGGRNHVIEVDSMFTNENQLEVDAAVDGFISITGIKDGWNMAIDPVVERKWLSTYYSESQIPARFERIKLGSSSEYQPEFIGGVGSPEGSVSAPVGSIFLNRQGSADKNSDQLWMKFSGSGASGWYPAQAVLSGSTAERPANPTPNQMYVDETLVMPIWYINGAWRDSQSNLV